MSTKWVVTAAAERIALGDKRSGETTFTVTNPDGIADRAVFDPVAGEGADPAWFAVDEPQRLVRGGASVSYVMKVAVPTESPPGTYAVQGRVYSADSAPEESSVLSPRVMLEVPAPPEPVKRKWPWWWWIVAAGLGLALLIGLGVLVVQLAGGEDAPPEPVPTPGAGEVVMPTLIGLSERDALDTLAEAGLTVRPIKYRHDPERPDQVIAQSPEAESITTTGMVVDLEVAVALTAPAITSPAGVPMIEPNTPAPTLAWDVGEAPVRRWQVSWSRERCFFVSPVLFVPPGIAVSGCHFPATDGLAVADEATHTPAISFQAASFGYAVNGEFHTGWVRWQVAALDDFGTAGPASEPAYLRMPVP